MANVPISNFTVPANTVGIGATGYSLTGSASASFMDLAGTWNTSGTPTLIKANVTDTASNASSRLLDLQVGGVSRFNVRKDGLVNIETTGGTFSFNGSIGFDLGTFSIVRAAGISFGPSNDLTIRRRTAANLALGSADTTGTTAPTAQTLSVQSWASSTNNNQPGANFTIEGSQGTGTGAGGSIVFRVAPAGGTSNGVQNALATALTITGALNVVPASNLEIDGANAGIEIFNSYADALARTITNRSASFTRNGIYFRSSAVFAFTSGSGAGTDGGNAGNADTILARDAANTLALRNGANAQTFRVYNTTDGTNGEFASFKWNSNVLEIASEIAGTGTRRPIAMVAGLGPYTVLKTTDYGIYARQITSSSGLNVYNSDANALAAGSTGRVAYIEGLTGICLSSSFEIKFSSSGDAASSHDSGIARSAAGVLRLTNASTGGGSLQLTEMTAPAAPATNNVRIYAEDNGAGKTRLMALFATGVAQQIAIEP